MKDETDKNLNVEIVRIFLTAAVCLHHFRLYSDAFPYGGGYIAVDAFFIISGYYLSRHLMVNMGGRKQGVIDYVIIRYKRLFPEYFLAFVISFICRWFMREIPSEDWWGYVREALMIEFWGMDSGLRINPPSWYCGYLLLAYIVVYPYIKHMKKYNNFIYITVFFTIGCYAAFAFYSPHMNIYPRYQSILNVAVGRGIAGLLQGCVIYLLNQKTRGIIDKEKRSLRYLLMFFIGIVLLYILFWENFLPYIDYAAIFLFSVLFYLVVSTKGEYKNIYCRRIIEYLGKLCFTVYLNHYLIAFIFARYSLFRMLDWKTVSICFLIAVFIFANIVFGIKKILFRFPRRDGGIR